MKNTTLIILGAAILAVSCRKEKVRICDVYASKQGYETGTVKSVTKGSLKATYNYAYSVNGVNYSGEEKAYGIGQSDPTMIGKKFVVVYNTDNPAESDLNTNYLIESTSDFDKYVAEFVVTPPKPDFPRKKCN